VRRDGADAMNDCARAADPRRCGSYSAVSMNANHHPIDAGRERRRDAWGRVAAPRGGSVPLITMTSMMTTTVQRPAAAREREGGTRAAATNRRRPNAPLGCTAPHALLVFLEDDCGAVPCRPQRRIRPHHWRVTSDQKGYVG